MAPASGEPSCTKHLQCYLVVVSSVKPRVVQVQAAWWSNDAPGCTSILICHSTDGCLQSLDLIAVTSLAALHLSAQLRRCLSVMGHIDQTLHCHCRNQLSVTPLFDAEGVCTHYVAVQQDVTARKASEAATQMRDFALSNLSEGICMVDPATAGQPLVYVNEAFCRMTGYSKKECLGRNARFMQVRVSWLA